MARIAGRDDAGSPTPTEHELGRKRALLAEMDGIGWYLRGSLLSVYNRCGSPGCRCKADPSALHGPYWQWTRKLGGKTVSVRLSDAQAELVRAWIDNARDIDRRLGELEQLSVEVTQRILAAVERR